MLTLPIKKKWFDMIASGEKLEEYRNITPYYTARFIRSLFYYAFVKRMTIMFRNGYSATSPKIKCFVRITVGKGREEWGAEPNKDYYKLEILSKEIL